MRGDIERLETIFPKNLHLNNHSELMTEHLRNVSH